MLLKGIAVLSLLPAVLICAVSGGFWLWAVPLCCLSYLLLLGFAFGFLWICCKAVDMEKEQEEDSKFYRSIMYVYIEALISLVLVRQPPV